MDLHTAVGAWFFPDPAVPDMMRIEDVAEQVNRSVAHLACMQADQLSKPLITIPVVLK